MIMLHESLQRIVIFFLCNMLTVIKCVPFKFTLYFVCFIWKDISVLPLLRHCSVAQFIYFFFFFRQHHLMNSYRKSIKMIIYEYCSKHGTCNTNQNEKNCIVEVILFSSFSPFPIGFNSYNELFHIQYFLHNNAIYDVNDYQLSSLIRRA